MPVRERAQHVCCCSTKRPAAMPVQMYIRAFTRAPDVHMSFVDSLVQVPAARAAVLGSIYRMIASITTGSCEAPRLATKDSIHASALIRRILKWYLWCRTGPSGVFLHDLSRQQPRQCARASIEPIQLNQYAILSLYKRCMPACGCIDDAGVHRMSNRAVGSCTSPSRKTCLRDVAVATE